jgi:hypothetical protein
MLSGMSRGKRWPQRTPAEADAGTFCRSASAVPVLLWVGRCLSVLVSKMSVLRTSLTKKLEGLKTRGWLAFVVLWLVMLRAVSAAIGNHKRIGL